MPLGLIALAAAAEVEQPPPRAPMSEQTRVDDNEAWIAAMAAAHGLTSEQIAAVRRVVTASEYMGQGNPAVTDHPMTREQCREKLTEAAVTWTDPASETICGRPYMAPLYDPGSQFADDAAVCIDRLEFPDVPCEYPVIWVRASEAQQLCQAVGKRLCDAHEWEGACAGSLQPPDYDWAASAAGQGAVGALGYAHNARQERAWAYGPEFQTGICAQDSYKTAGCSGGDWSRCGSNTYPAGAFPGCVSALGVADQHGNAAEHMNLPLAPDQLASAGGTLGVTEMKGSWFIWDKYRAHEDWCRWRAPFWHGGPVMDPDSHRNYHLGFRCCADVDEEGP
jgi:formylglycine-generating enzyme required for sulfatase activity